MAIGPEALKMIQLSGFISWKLNDGEMSGGNGRAADGALNNSGIWDGNVIRWCQHITA